MKNLNLILGAALLVGGSAAYGDTLASSPVTFSFTDPVTTANTFWNNPSSDTVAGLHTADVGNFLTGTGSFAGTQPDRITSGKMYINSANTPDFINGLNFARQAGALQITLLYANSGANQRAEIGIYNAADPANQHTILQADSLIDLNVAAGTPATVYNLPSGSPYASWGLYERVCLSGNAVSMSTCQAAGNVVTYYQGVGSQLNPNQSQDIGHQHFALFQAASNNVYYAGIEDWAFNASTPNAAGNPPEGYGDYNDLIFGITTSIQSAVPEPATLSIMGLGLAGLGLLGRRKLKK